MSFRKRKVSAPFFRLPSPTDPVSGKSNYLYPPLKQCTRFTLLEGLTTSNEYADAEITNEDQWGQNPIFHPPEIHIYVHNQLSDNNQDYLFSGGAGDVGLALHDYENHWRIIWMQPELVATQYWYLGKTTEDIAAGGNGTAELYSSGWSASGTTFSVHNPHDIELPSGLKIRWASQNVYYGWAAYVAEPWQWTECPAEGY